MKNYEDNKTKFKKLEDIEILIENKNKEMENIKNEFDKKNGENN